MCIGATATYTSNGTTGGSWSSSNTAVATVNSTTGVVTAVSAGTTNITYTLSNGCGSPVSASKTLTVSANANAGTVSGSSPLCAGATATYTSNGDAGGSWSSTNTAVATVNATTGVVTAVSAGTTNITYTVNSGCGSPVSAFKTLTVNASQNIYCGNNNNKVIVCHNGNELCISASAVPAHLAHGDILGRCPTVVIRSANNQVTESLDKMVVTAYPNPYEQEFKLNIKSPVSGMATIKFYNTSGNKVYELKQHVMANISNIVEVKNTAMFKASVFYRISVGSNTSAGIVIKQD